MSTKQTGSALFTIEAGLLLRRAVRRGLIASGFSFTEDKGLLDSQFVVSASAADREKLAAWLRSVGSEVVRDR